MHVLGLGLVSLCLTSSAGDKAPLAGDFAGKARAVLQTHCYRCHGQEGANEGGFNYALDLSQLVARNKVTPGNPQKSRLLKRIRNADDPMPPADEKSRPSADDISALERWIEAGAPSAETSPARPFVAIDETIRAIHDDLEKAEPRRRPFLRYFTLAHLHNAGLSAEELHSYRHGVSKLVNSLSWEKEIVVPKAIDAAQTILRIDLRDYQWTGKTWDVLLGKNPYSLRLPSAAFQRVREWTECDEPLVRGDWFVALASRPPLYHDVLRLPATEQQLERMLRVDVAENIKQERVARSGFNSSGVSRNNRLIERHESSGVVYWRSYDFAGNTGRQNLFAHPLGPGDDLQSFACDGGEVIFTLPNGLHAYFLTDAAGRRLDKGPTTIVSDPRRPDRAVENGVSCMSCHARGLIDKADQVLPHVRENPQAFTGQAIERVAALYPPAGKFSALVQSDTKRFQDAVAKTGAPLSRTEPIVALALRFEAELDLTLTAAEAGMRPRDLLQILDRFPHLARHLGPLRVAGGTIQRQVLIDIFQDLAEAARTTRIASARSPEVDKLLDQAHALLADQPEKALAMLKQAAAKEPDDPAVHLAQGDAHRRLGQWPQAVACYTETIRLDARSSVAFNNRGLALQKLGSLDKAIADFSAAVRLEPRFAVAFFNRGAAHYAGDDPDKAIADYSEALGIDPKFARAYNNRGYAFIDKDDLGRALADFDQALKLEPGFAVAHNNRGLVHYRKNRFGAAIVDFSEAIRLDPKMASAYLNRGLAHARLGDSVRAEADRRKARELDPNLE
jgi:tetratricopeptide (TPR) repeat protein